MWLTQIVNSIVVAAAAIVSYVLAQNGIAAEDAALMAFSNWTAGIGLGYAVCWIWMNVMHFFDG